MLQEIAQDNLDGLRFHLVKYEAVMIVRDDAPAVPGGQHRQAVCKGFELCEAEAVRESRKYEEISGLIVSVDLASRLGSMYYDARIAPAGVGNINLKRAHDVELQGGIRHVLDRSQKGPNALSECYLPEKEQP